jgi:iron complex outermembrane receptor protein
MLLLSGLVSGRAGAQSGEVAAVPNPQGNGSAAADYGVEDIVVTAQKRSERLQDVPIAVAAVTAAQAAERGVLNTMDLRIAVPGLEFNKTVNEGNIFLRGVGTNLYGPNTEQTVAMYVDGIYLASPQASLFSFNNVQQIEVLKGPQGTLFGRNTTGGVVHIITRDPSFTPALDLNVGYANYDTKSASLYATAGVSETIAANIAVNYADQGKGYGRNLTTGAKTYIQADDNFGVRGKLLFTPTESTKILLTGEYDHSVNTDAYRVIDGVVGPDGVLSNFGRYDVRGNLSELQRTNVSAVSLRIEQEVGPLRLVSLTAYRDVDAKSVLDQDETPQIYADDLLSSKTKSFSQELQLQSDSAAKIKWVLGAYYYAAKSGFVPADINLGVNATPGDPSSYVYLGHAIFDDHQKTKSYAAFGQATTEILDKTNLTLGLRYTSEDQTFIVDRFSLFGAEIPVPTAKQNFKKLTWRAALDHHFAQDVLGYLSYNRGFKSGGFNLLRPFDAPYKPEQLDAYEVGLKTQLFDRHLRLNLAAFYYDYREIQMQVPVAGATVVVNGPKAEVKGVELDFEARVTEALTLSGGATYLDSKYTKFPVGPVIDSQGNQTDCNVPPNNPVCDLTGNATTSAPKFVVNMTIDYAIDTNFGSLHPSVTGQYNDGYFYYPDNRLRQPSYVLINAALTWTSLDEKYSVRLWGRNLTDKLYYLGRSEQGGLSDAERVAGPRTYGVTLSAHF